MTSAAAEQASTTLRRFLADEAGGTVVEYVAIASGLGITLVAALGGSSGMLTEAFALISTEMKEAAPK